MTQLVELPSNNGQIFAVDPHTVTGIQHHRGTLPGRGIETFDMCAVWAKPLEDGATTQVFICAWTVHDTVAYLNNHRQAQANLFGAGYRRGAEDAAGTSGADEQSLRDAWHVHLRSVRETVRQ